MIKNAIREMPKLVRANLTIGGNTMFDYAGFIKAVLQQDGTEIHSYFADDAVINWHCTNECLQWMNTSLQTASTQGNGMVK